MLIGESAVMHQLRERVARLSRTTFTVLVEGESGSGKELVGRQLHLGGPRARGPFVAVNCAAIVETLVEAELFGIEERTATGVRGRRGKFELADRGTLFLDEVGDLSPTAQAKLLRVLQDMTIERVGGATPQVVDTRVVAATNRNLAEMVAAGQFRADLYYRLSGVEILVPPLRSRREDIPVLTAHFLALNGASERVSVTRAAAEALARYEWPGNVRQLGRVIERALALSVSNALTTADLPDPIANCAHRRADPTGESLRAWSSRYVRSVLERCQGNKRRACDVLDISYHTLQSHLEYGTKRLPRVSEPPVSEDLPYEVESA